MQTRNGILGAAVKRIDGPLKVSGKATYAYDQQPNSPPLYGYIVGATIARGRVSAIETKAALGVPGVTLVLTHLNVPRQTGFAGTDVPAGRTDVDPFARPTLDSDRVKYWGQPVACVVADSFEIARHAAGLVGVTYEEEPIKADLYGHLTEAVRPASVWATESVDTLRGDLNDAWRKAAVRIEQVYRTPYHIHCAMEPHATIAEWNGDNVTIYTSTQIVSFAMITTSKTLGISAETIRIISPFQGGGFGGKLWMKEEAMLAVIAARMVRRPVKIAQTRQQTFSNVGHRPATHQVIRLSADRDGRLLGVEHHVTMQNSTFREVGEQTAVAARSLYNSAANATSHRVVKLDLPSGESTRSPGETPGLLALETAMDELAAELDIDPIDLRILNEPEIDLELNIPFSARNLVRCYREGAERFGWSNRPLRPASLRDGKWLVGYGMAAAFRPASQVNGTASVHIDRSGRVIVKLDMTDIGTGSYTILAQVAAEELGLPISSVDVLLGDSRFPAGLGSGGSWGAATSAQAVRAACIALREDLTRRTSSAPNTVSTITEMAQSLGNDGLTVEGSTPTDETAKTLSKRTFGAQFAEVGVDIVTGEVRVRRMLGVFDAGKIINPITARSQLIGAMIWGVSAALHEEGLIDTRYGQFVNRDLGEYHVPVHADIRQVEAIMLDEPDFSANPMGVKGLGELGICGSPAAIGNAVFNATGVRVRDFPITVEKLLAGLPAL